MQKKDTIQDKDNERDPLISYFRTLEKEVPEADIEKTLECFNAKCKSRACFQTTQVFANIYVSGRGGCFICRYRLGNKKYIWIIIHIP